MPEDDQRAKERPLALEDLRTPEDIERLDVREYVRLATRPVSHLDLLYVELRLQVLITEFAERVREAMSREPEKPS